MASCSHVGLAPWAWLSIVHNEALGPLARWHIIHEISVHAASWAYAGPGKGGGGGGSLVSNDSPSKVRVTLPLPLKKSIRIYA